MHKASVILSLLLVPSLFLFADEKPKSGLQSIFKGYGTKISSGKISVELGGIEEAYEGTVDREAVRRVLRSLAKAIEGCHERQLAKLSESENKVVVHFQISDKGKVSNATTKSTTFKNPTIPACIEARIREQRFPEAPSGTTVYIDFPFLFRTKK